MLSTKKVASALLAATMMFGAAVPAFATDLGDLESLTKADNALTVNGTMSAPTIKVVLPTAGSMVMNPYQLKVQFTGDGESSDQDHTEQVLYKTQYIENQSNVPMNVSVTVTGKTEGDTKNMAFSTTALKGTETNKAMYLYLQQKVAEPATSGNHTVTWAKTYNKATDVLVAAKATTLKDFATLKAADSTTYSALAFRLAGDLAKAPATGWTSDDKVSVTIAYSFTMTSNTVSGS